MIRITWFLDLPIVEYSKQKMLWILALFVASGEKMGLCLFILVHYKESVEVYEILSVMYHSDPLEFM
jgi:hypothetical protein